MQTTGAAAPPAPARAARRSTRNTEVEGLRAIAALAVLVTHVSLNAMGNRGPFGGLMARLDVGVPVFFVISGYLLYRPFAAALLRDEPRPALRRYLRHRLLAHRPPLLGRGGGVVPVRTSDGGRSADPGVQPPGHRSHGSAALEHGPASPRSLQVYWKDSLAGPFPQAWTLAVEMSFYLLLPALAWTLARRRGRSRAERLRTQWVALGAMVLLAQAFRLATVMLDPAFTGDIGVRYTQAQGLVARPPRPVRLRHGDGGACGSNTTMTDRRPPWPSGSTGSSLVLAPPGSRHWSRSARSSSLATAWVCRAPDLSYHRVWGSSPRHWTFAGGGHGPGPPSGLRPRRARRGPGVPVVTAHAVPGAHLLRHLPVADHRDRPMGERAVLRGRAGHRRPPPLVSSSTSPSGRRWRGRSP